MGWLGCGFQRQNVATIDMYPNRLHVLADTKRTFIPKVVVLGEMFINREICGVEKMRIHG